MTRRPFFLGLATILAVVVTGIAIQARFDARKQSAPPHAERPTAGVSASLPLAATGGEDITAALAAWTQGIEDEQERVAALEVAALEAARRGGGPGAAAPRVGTSYTGVGDCTGFAIPDYIIQRESGGNPYAENRSSGAFGCAQVMPFHWAPGGACEGLDRWNIEDQRTCVDWLSQGGTRLSPWGG